MVQGFNFYLSDHSRTWNCTFLWGLHTLVPGSDLHFIVRHSRYEHLLNDYNVKTEQDYLNLGTAIGEFTFIF